MAYKNKNNTNNNNKWQQLQVPGKQKSLQRVTLQSGKKQN